MWLDRLQLSGLVLTITTPWSQLQHCTNSRIAQYLHRDEREERISIILSLMQALYSTLQYCTACMIKDVTESEECGYQIHLRLIYEFHRSVNLLLCFWQNVAMALLVKLSLTVFLVLSHLASISSHGTHSTHYTIDSNVNETALDKYLNRCMAGISHKDFPGPEPNLHDQVRSIWGSFVLISPEIKEHERLFNCGECIDQKL